MGVADSYGAGFEFAPQNLIHNNLRAYVKHPKYDIGNGRYTDDTQMASALAEHLVLKRPIDRNLIAHSFLLAYRRDPRAGYSGRVQDALNTAKTGEELVSILSPNKSLGNGAAMRAAVVGFLHSEQEVLHVAAEQALATHDSVSGVESAQSIALAAYGLRKGISRVDIVDYLRDHWIKVEKIGNHGEGYYTVWTALMALRSGKSLSEIMKNAVGYGGDTDTVAAIAVALGTQSKEVSQILPRNLTKSFEDGTYGSEFLANLDTKLIKLSGPQTALF